MLFITVPPKAFLFFITHFSLFFHSFSENIRHERNNEDGNIHKKLENGIKTEYYYHNRIFK